MDNCDLDYLSMSDGELNPSFRSDLTQYTATVESRVKTSTLHLQTSDGGASCNILFGDGSRTVKLEDGLNKVEIEVVSEDGSSKVYSIAVSKLSSRAAQLSDLTIERGHDLHPGFSPATYDYTCSARFDCCEVRVHPQTLDRSMQTAVNDTACSEPVMLNAGETVIIIKVTSADGANTQVYTVNVTREPVPLAVAFCDVKDQMEFECPVSLSALYKPVSIHQSEPKTVFSAPYIDMLTRRSKVDPFTERPLREGWKVLESELDQRMSNAPVKCFFSYRGCRKQMRYAEIGAHAKECHYKPSSDLDSVVSLTGSLRLDFSSEMFVSVWFHTLADCLVNSSTLGLLCSLLFKKSFVSLQEVTETNWYRNYFASSSNTEIMTHHTLEIRNWEKRLQTALGEHDVDSLIAHAEEHFKLYKNRLPNPGDVMQYDPGQSPLDHLEQAAVHYASAIKVKPHNAKLHFLLGQTLEEHYYATEMYGLKKEAQEDDQDLGQAKSAGRQEEILAICRLHGFPGTPTAENQLKALDTELQDLRQQGQSAKADYVQTLFLWLSKKAGKQDGSSVVSDEKCWLHRALLKYLDACSLNADSWEYNLHMGRLLLLQGKSNEALQHLQSALGLQPRQPAIRFYTGLALLQKEEAAAVSKCEVVMLLQQGLEYVMAQFFISHDHNEQQQWDGGYDRSVVNAQFLRGCLSLAALLSKISSSDQAMSPEQVYHIVSGLAAQGISRCVNQGEVLQQLDSVLLEAHFALLQGLIQQQRDGKQPWIVKRCQALTALIRLSSIGPCRELLDMQEKVCQMGVLALPRCSRALCLLGLAQLAQSDSHAADERARAALTDACLSFQASIELEGSHQTGEAPKQLTKQTWWKDHLDAEKDKTVKHEAPEPKPAVKSSEAPADGKKRARGRGAPARGVLTSTVKTSAPTRVNKTATAAARGRTGVHLVTKSDGAGKTAGKSSIKAQMSSCKSLLQEKPTTSAVEVGKKSFVPRLGLARALARTADSKKQACHFYQEVIDMAPEVHDAYIELANLLLKDDPLAAVDVYSRFPLKPFCEQTFDDAFITGEIVHILMKHELYEHPQLLPNLIAHGKVMGLGCLDKYIEALEGKFMTSLLRRVYAGIHDKSVDDEELQDFFRFKCWI
ncbi:uncharacterized protein LOC131551945 isoform X2 [Onychostoma macrolepis]|uniref:uncharacterized protein LOC131551945 isoform X2 n=1 Tax=Onychostoma macrolepis TaxID=369639 RepID=UPI00272D9A1B|nr:uncharacterized protein LOC131551945 isoform X2 [Onychostoma macrolepis]